MRAAMRWRQEAADIGARRGEPGHPPNQVGEMGSGRSGLIILQRWPGFDLPPGKTAYVNASGGMVRMSTTGAQGRPVPVSAMGVARINVSR